jgi:hypothetical protein
MELGTGRARELFQMDNVTVNTELARTTMERHQKHGRYDCRGTLVGTVTVGVS